MFDDSSLTNHHVKRFYVVIDSVNAHKIIVDMFIVYKYPFM